MTAKTRIFLAHASEDKGLVRDLYSKLVNRGFKPWLDEIAIEAKTRNHIFEFSNLPGLIEKVLNFELFTLGLYLSGRIYSEMSTEDA